MPYKISIVLDKRRLERIKGTPVEKLVKEIYGGYLKVIDVDVTDEQGKKILAEFPRARIDARGYIEEVPIAFKRELFEIIVEKKSAGPEVIDEILKPERLNKVKEAGEKEEEYIPPPEIPTE